MDSANHVENNALLSNASNVIAITAHEFKTPLTTITSVVDLLSAKLKADQHMNAFYEKQLARITTEVFSLNSMVDEMLTINNIVSGHIEAVKELIDLSNYVLPLKEQYHAYIEDNRQPEIVLTGTPKKIYASPAQITRILTNLVSNACKYSRDKAPVIHLDYQEHAAVITVSNDGIGIPEQDLPYLFDPYFRGSNTAGIAGTGLGLSIVKSFTAANNGNITVTSSPDKGTVFTLAFKYPDTCK
ncbi:sensor histidine kinase [Chitinophaga rhizophila]|uniref:histidine kinase n=1 Tax=Chitinophaga rhizophila TaxID=2866212 RepID=A0ABS7GA30_9BACT|nr:HAMP domain-containing sensor histidine kinase [Chitinophaga rhizophila]MBW8683669.1 HAMP domain-containing histidine kinase [Chitinophaga rhizophila]